MTEIAFLLINAYKYICNYACLIAIILIFHVTLSLTLYILLVSESSQMQFYN